MCKRYKVTPEDARTALLDAFQAQPGLLEEINTRHPNEDVTRMRSYKNAVKAARKQIYYQLRQYKRETPENVDLTARLAGQIEAGAAPKEIDKTCQKLLKTHTSTAERDQKTFYDALLALVDTPVETVIDAGSGLQPLAYPYREAGTNLYVAIDSDAEVIHTLTTFAQSLKATDFVAIQADLVTFSWAAVDFEPGDYDLALMLKLIPVVTRQNRDILEYLVEVPAKRILITGNLESLTRHESIRAREDKVLRAFIELSGRRITGELEVSGEFGYLLE